MSLNVSLEDSLEEFARAKVSRGEYGSVSEVVRDGLLLLQRSEDLWKKEMRAKIEEGVAQCRAGLTVPAEQAWAELKAHRDEQKKKLGL
ncbi:MAG TPA: type II toxin-antitoxin system ParD family antitoxin [Chthoniobacteraceae bacterium]|jgi:putative addiction module CopG family antidote|nr:type II toxin-antitoxin system ParD family antitoxin [Chthoniobacteraceae bacterium]